METCPKRKMGILHENCSSTKVPGQTSNIMTQFAEINWSISLSEVHLGIEAAFGHECCRVINVSKFLVPVCWAVVDYCLSYRTRTVMYESDITIGLRNGSHWANNFWGLVANYIVTIFYFTNDLSFVIQFASRSSWRVVLAGHWLYMSINYVKPIFYSVKNELTVKIIP